MAMAVLAAFLTLIVAHGFEYKIRDSNYIFEYFSFFTVGFFACWIYFSKSLLGLNSNEAIYTLKRHYLWFPTILAVILSLYLTLKPRDALLAIGIASAIAFILLRSKKEIYFYLFILLTLVFVIEQSLSQSIASVASDILPIIEAANKQLLAGNNPYYADYSLITPNAYFYLPLQSLVYMPFEWLGVSYVWLNIICYLGLFAIFMHTAKDQNSLYLYLLIYPILLSTLMWQLIIGAQVLTYFLPLGLGLHFLLKDKIFLAALFFGVAVAMRQTAVIYLGLLFIYLYQTRNLSDVLKVAIIGMLPLCFSLGIFEYIWPGTTHHLFIELPAEQIERSALSGNPFRQVALTGWIHATLGAGSHVYLQLVFSIVSATFIFHQAKGKQAIGFTTLCYIAVSYILIVSLNGYMHRYYYYPAFIILMFAFLSKKQQPEI